MPWNHQFIDPTGRVKPCCRFAEKHRPKENNLNDMELSDIFYGDWMNSVRSKMLAGERVDGCIRCYQEEDSGKRSLRERYNRKKNLSSDDLVDINLPKIKWIELAISNECNLACRMCDSKYSWKWFEEEKNIYKTPMSLEKHTKIDIKKLYPFIDDLVHLKFTGGEPLITPDHWIFIDKLLEQRDCSNISLNYSTNCTIPPKVKWIEKWSKFKTVEFAMSFDSAIPGESEYIRWPAKWETIESVTKQFLELKKNQKFDVMLRSTISVFNIWHMPETMSWWHNNDPGPKLMMNPTHLTYPDFLCVTVLPSPIKDRITKKFNEFQKNCKNNNINNSVDYIKNFMNSKNDVHLLEKLKNYIEKTDEHRKQNFFEIYPYFSDIFD